MMPVDTVAATNRRTRRVEAEARAGAGNAQSAGVPRMRQREVRHETGVPVNLQIFFSTAGIAVTLIAIGAQTGVVSQETVVTAGRLLIAACVARGLYYFAKEA